MKNKDYIDFINIWHWKVIFGFTFLIVFSIILILCKNVNADGSGEDYPAPKNGD